jgi:hypothetical protein
VVVDRGGARSDLAVPWSVTHTDVSWCWVRALLITAALVLACSPSAPATTQTVLVATPPPSPDPAAVPGPAAAPAARPCPFQRAPARPVPPPPAQCANVPSALAASLRRTMESRYRPYVQNARLDVTFACDPLDDPIEELVFERGAGHGFSLQLWRFQRRRDGSAYDVRAIGYALDARANGGGVPEGYVLGSGVVGARELRTRLDLVRATLLATLTEVEPPLPPGAMHGFSTSASSHDFHLLLRLRDAAGRELAGRYTGYESTGESQRLHLPLEIAAEEIEPLLEPVDLAAGAATDEDRAFFAERFNDTIGRFDDDFHWWVTERYVSMARGLGSPLLVPGLLGRLRVASEDDRSTVDARADALEALARITGWDARADERGAARSATEAAEAYRQACAGALEP